MSFDDDLRRRMRDAADRAGAGADPAAAAQQIGASLAASGGSGMATVGIIGGLAGLGLVVGGVLGATALRPTADEPGASEPPSAPAQVAAGEVGVYDCPDGDIVRELHPGDRVYVIGRDADGGWSAFRDPDDIGTTVWLPNAALGPDADVEVPVVECSAAFPLTVGGVPPTTTTSTSVPGSTTSTTTTTSTTSTSTTSTSLPSSTTTAATTTTPGQNPPPATTVAPTTTTRSATTVAPTTTSPPATTAAPTTTRAPTSTRAPTTTAAPTTTQPPDTQAPVVGQPQAAHDPICEEGATSLPHPEQTTISVIATDNVGVDAVSATDSLTGATFTFSQSGNTWQGTFGPVSGVPPNVTANVTITITARDAAGNTASTNTSVTVWSTEACEFG